MRPWKFFLTSSVEAVLIVSCFFLDPLAAILCFAAVVVAAFTWGTEN